MYRNRKLGVGDADRKYKLPAEVRQSLWFASLKLVLSLCSQVLSQVPSKDRQVSSQVQSPKL